MMTFCKNSRAYLLSRRGNLQGCSLPKYLQSCNHERPFALSFFNGRWERKNHSTIGRMFDQLDDLFGGRLGKCNTLFSQPKPYYDIRFTGVGRSTDSLVGRPTINKYLVHSFSPDRLWRPWCSLHRQKDPSGSNAATVSSTYTRAMRPSKLCWHLKQLRETWCTRIRRPFATAAPFTILYDPFTSNPLAPKPLARTLLCRWADPGSGCM